MIPVRDTIPSRTPPLFTWTIILVNAVVLLVEVGLPEPALERLRIAVRREVARVWSVRDPTYVNFGR